MARSKKVLNLLKAGFYYIVPSETVFKRIAVGLTEFRTNDGCNDSRCF